MDRVKGFNETMLDGIFKRARDAVTHTAPASKPLRLVRGWNYGTEWAIMVGDKVLYTSCYELAAVEMLAQLRSRHGTHSS